MKKIIGILRPFDLKQQFFVYQDGNKIDAISVKMDDIPQSILTLASQYNIHQIDLTGPKQYSRGISKNIYKLQQSKYSDYTLNINLI